jgi:hypothetical protein
MKFNIKNFPKTVEGENKDEADIWAEGFEKELRQTLEWTEKKWHPRSPRLKGMREECIHRMKEILGDEP